MLAWFRELAVEGSRRLPRRCTPSPSADRALPRSLAAALTQISSNLAGLAVGFGSVAATAMYQIWAGVKQKELGLGSMQLLDQYVPLAAGLLGTLVPIFEPMGWTDPGPHTVLGYQFSAGAVVAIAVSALLGLLVNLSTFLVRARWAGAARVACWALCRPAEPFLGLSSCGAVAGGSGAGVAATCLGKWGQKGGREGLVLGEGGAGRPCARYALSFPPG